MTRRPRRVRSIGFWDWFPIAVFFAAWLMSGCAHVDLIYRRDARLLREAMQFRRDTERAHPRDACELHQLKPDGFVRVLCISEDGGAFIVDGQIR